MGQLLAIEKVDLVSWGKSLRSARDMHGLTLRQAAAALEISPITLDGWEQGRKPQMDVDVVNIKFEEFKSKAEFCWKTGNNLLFGAFPLRVARDILGLSASEMAEELMMSHSSWTKMEANARIVPDSTLSLIEGRVLYALQAACGRKPAFE